MEQNDQWEIKNRLLTLRERLFLKILQKNAEASRDLDEGLNDFCDHSSIDSTKELLHLLSDANREELIRIDEALERLESGHYGKCVVCGDHIDEKRLAIQPHTPYCISCKEQMEHKEQVKEPERGQL